ncbi:MAG: glycosyltransferase, partial [Desulfovibrio sp.]|nr:glycosyltransferase [Desulfovibrio sp.]
MTPAVSVIMNCLNCARDLPGALESVRRQTFQDFEIIFWDNGSTDESAAIAKAYGPRLRYFYGARTVPLGAARNLALAEAAGRYVAFLDCDDLWRPEKLQKQVALFEANARVGLVCTDTEIVDGRRVLSRVFAQSAPGRGRVFAELMARQWISMSSAMVRREALESVACSPAGEEAGCAGRWLDPRQNRWEGADRV